MTSQSEIPNNPSSSINYQSRPGSVLLVVVLLVALLAAVVMGHLQVNTEEIRLMQNHCGSVEALAVAEAGLNEALAELKQNPGWDAGCTDRPFGTGTYTVAVRGSTVTSTARTQGGFVVRVAARVTRGPDGTLQVDQWRINP